MLYSTTATADAELARYLAAAGTAHSKMGHVVQAAKFYEMALDTYNRSLVPNHPSIAALLNNYGVLYEHKGEYDKAVAMHEQALMMRQQVLGEWHTDVSVSLNNLAILHRRIGNYKQAMPLSEKSHTYTYIRGTYIHTYIHTNIHTCMHAYIHTYIHTYIVIHTTCKCTYSRTDRQLQAGDSALRKEPRHPPALARRDPRRRCRVPQQPWTVLPPHGRAA